VTEQPESVPTDEELAQRARLGCVESFEQLMRRFQAPVLHFLLHRGLGADAEDVLQETFVRAYSNLARYRPKWRFATWLFTIARRLSINHRRRVTPANGGDSLEQALGREPEPGATLADEEERLGLWARAAGVLSEPELTALWLLYVEDMPVREIAAVVDRSTAAVKTMLFRARVKLAPLLHDFRPGRSADDRSVPCRPAAQGFSSRTRGAV
jgi:RNA polymerase sigma-70 factor (ECF subfamily)